jgi:amidohydrolase
MAANIVDEIRVWQDELAAFRRDIHAHPETGFEETRTASLVAQRLRSLGIAVTEGVGNTGVVGTLKGRRPGQRAIALRADMDALNIVEDTGLAYSSTHPTKMHACGHDGHTTMLLGAATHLAQNPDFGGTVHFIFQPAEEGMGGARLMLKEGLFERFPCDSVYGLHNMPGLPLGQFSIRPGPMMAGGGKFIVRFKGTGGHGGASPHLSTDVTVVQAHFVLALQTVISRNVSPLDTGVISVGHIGGGIAAASNVMPAEILLTGTFRHYTDITRDVILRRIEELAHGLAAMHGCTAEVECSIQAVPLSNHAEQTEVAVAAARDIAGDAAVDPNGKSTTGGEDFADMLNAKPGAFIFLGAGEERAGVHTPRYDFNDEIIPLGAAYWVSLVRRELAVEA